ncbi:hypothetical protein GIB67_010722, partial [Kingdonia uniflora]
QFAETIYSPDPGVRIIVMELGPQGRDVEATEVVDLHYSYLIVLFPFENYYLVVNASSSKEVAGVPLTTSPSLCTTSPEVLLSPSCLLHNKQLGDGYYKIEIFNVINEDALFFRQDSFTKIMGDVGAGGFVAWPKCMGNFKSFTSLRCRRKGLVQMALVSPICCYPFLRIQSGRARRHTKVVTKLEVFPGSKFRVAYEEAVKYGGKRRLGYGPTPFSHLMMMWASCIMYQDGRSWMDGNDEAYEEFKHVLLALIYGKDDQTSPVANEWAVIRRLEIAGLLSYVLRAYLSAYDPIFSMTLRYLISIHKGFCLCQGISSPILDLTERLPLEERGPPPVPQESLYEAPPFDEVDIQALAHAVEPTRQAVVDSLEFSKGNLFQAFQNEISRTKLNVELLDELVHEYYVYRGLLEGGITSSFSDILLGQQISVGSSANHEQGLGYVSSKVSNSDFIDDSSKETNAEAMVIDSTELRFINELVQEFLALPRADAIHLLAQYNGNAETMIQQIFA